MTRWAIEELRMASRGAARPKCVGLAIMLVLAATPAAAQRDPGWELRVPDTLELVAGSTGSLPIAIAVDRGLAISKDAGLVIDLAPDPGIAIKKRRLGRSDAADPDADAPRFAVPDHAIKLRVRFWLCGHQVCRPIDVRRSLTVSVAT
jgi:hypothetical protein